jgi:hypothetical protein
MLFPFAYKVYNRRNSGLLQIDKRISSATTDFIRPVCTCSARLIKFVVFDGVRLSAFYIVYHNGMSSTKNNSLLNIFYCGLSV